MTAYAKRRNKRRAVLRQAEKKLPPAEYEALRTALERIQDRDHRNTPRKEQGK